MCMTTYRFNERLKTTQCSTIDHSNVCAFLVVALNTFYPLHILRNLFHRYSLTADASQTIISIKIELVEQYFILNGLPLVLLCMIFRFVFYFSLLFLLLLFLVCIWRKKRIHPKLYLVWHVLFVRLATLMHFS